MVHKNSSRHMDHRKLWCNIYLFHNHFYQSTHFCRVHTLPCCSIYPGHNYASLSTQMHTFHIVLAHVHSMDSGTGNLITRLCSTCYIHDSHYLCSILVVVAVMDTLHIFLFPHSHPIILLCSTCYIHDSHSDWSTPILTNIFHGQWCIVPCGSIPANYDANYSHSHYLCSMLVVAFRSILHDQWCIVPCGSMTRDANYSHSHYLCSIFGSIFYIVLFPHSHPITLLCSTCYIHDIHYL